MSSFVSSQSKNKSSNQNKGDALFQEFFNQYYKGRWSSLNESLLIKEKQVLRKNMFIDSINSMDQILNEDNSVPNQKSIHAFQQCDFLNNCFWRPEDFSLQKNINNFYDFYVMDPASIIVAMALNVQATDRVLDMCAAPGGKTLVLAETMYLKSLQEKRSEIKLVHEHVDDYEFGQLISNEYSESRRQKLMRVLNEYIPKEKRLFINVRGLDANQFGLREPESFDKILADVPCSGERHLLENPKELSLWSKRRTENLSVRQYSILSSAWHALKNTGRIVYSTCSISQFENDDVVAKLIKKRNAKTKNFDSVNQFQFIEKTEFGYQILPDQCGFGPMYFSIIEKD